MNSRTTPSIVTRRARRNRRRAPLVESLENRQLLSLTIDLRLPGGAKTANVNSVGQVVNVEIWATAKGNNTIGSDEGLQLVTGSLVSTNVNGGAANGTLKTAKVSPFNASGSQFGKQQDLDGDGDLDVGSSGEDGSDYFAARSSDVADGGIVSGATQSFKIGTATFTVGSLKTGGTTNLQWKTRNYTLASIWREDGSTALKAPFNGTFQVGAPLVISRGGTTTGATVSGKVYKDANKNNTFDTGDTGFASVTLFLDTDKDGIKDTGEKTAVSDASGNYAFSGLAAGSYRVREVVPSGFKVTNPSLGYFDVTLTSTQTLTGKNFANQSIATTGTISGKVFNDLDGDGVLDTGETGRSSVRVYLDKDKDGIFDATEPNKLTDSAGNYSFTAIANGGYRVRIVGVSGFRISTPSAGYYDLTVAGNTLAGKNFGLTQKVLISGRLWVDTDNDGVKDSTEVVLAGWRVFIDKDKDGVFDTGESSVLTDSSGNYSFKGLAAGSYRVRVVQQTGYTRLAPSLGYYDLTLSNGQTATNKNFRYKKP